MAADGLSDVRRRIAGAAGRSGRSGNDVLLVVVTKGHPVADIEELYRAGQRHFGENRAQELVEKAPLLPGDIVWHFVGPLQTNKAALVHDVASWLHSMDRRKLGRRWNAPDSPPALLQVNVAEEPQKSGVSPAAAGELAAELLDTGVPLRGLMAIPPEPDQPEDSRHWFRLLAGLRAELAVRHPELTELSMGMSDDFEVAIAEGATVLRVGRAIFDPFEDEG